MFHVKLICLLLFLVIYFQFYTYATLGKTVEKQKRCRALGIFSYVAGIGCLISRDYLLALAGLILMMFGFRLFAYGLDRLDKKIYIDCYEEPPSD